MTPLCFRSGADTLYGVLHEPDPAAFAGHGVLFCNAFGQEAIRSHRAFRVLAGRLARLGIASMRFDYFGTGDSDGNDEDASLARWAADVRAAANELRTRLGCSSTSWFGLRLGAAVAATASQTARPAPERLILWDPVTDGRSFLAAAARSHAQELALALPAVPDIGSLLPSGADREFLGFALPPGFVDEIGAIDRSTFAAAACRHIAWIDSTAPELMPPITGAASATYNRVAAVNWATDEAMNSSVVPPDVVAAALREATSRDNG